jgi:hypothetical protein
VKFQFNKGTETSEFKSPKISKIKFCFNYQFIAKPCRAIISQAAGYNRKQKVVSYYLFNVSNILIKKFGPAYIIPDLVARGMGNSYLIGLG